MEHVRVTTPDLQHRARLDKARKRMLVSAGLFSLLYVVLALRLTYATIIHPILPTQAVLAAMQPQLDMTPPPPGRASITDRNGTILAVSLPGAELYADPKQVPNAADAAAKLASVLPGLDVAETAKRLSSGKDFVYLDRKLTPSEELAVNALGIPGVNFESGEKRHYPEGDLAAHILGGIDVGGKGIAGVEEYFQTRLTTNPASLALSIDIGIEGIVHDELASAIKEFQSPGGCAIVMNAHTGEVLAMVSLPDYDAGTLGDASADSRFNRCVTGNYEPGSVFKLQTVSMALDSGMIHYWDYFDTSHPLHVGKFTITDFEPTNVWMAVPQIINVSSNIGASRIATILGPHIEQDWYRKQGFFNKLPVELPEASPPLYPSLKNWGLSTTMTVSFGNGIAVSPLHLVTGVLPIVNGGIRYNPTLVAVPPTGPQPQGVRVMSQETSDIMRKLMTGVVMSGTGKNAAVPGYVIGGKTGTAQVVGPDGKYLQHTNNASFMAAFPMNDPQYVIYVLVLQPKPDATTAGFTTGGVIAAPTVGRIIARIGPMLGVLPATGDTLAALQASLTIPMNPTPPPGQTALGPNHPLPAGANGFAYELLGEKPPGDSPAKTGHPDRLLSQSHDGSQRPAPAAPLDPKGHLAARAPRVKNVEIANN
ncbi:MAG: peptidoglycan glycosyltransferase [Acidocella sp. 20-57-95]|nr:MAG: peptidoglycan glycosyltransferase [Acidocella sp. 20-57-95]OYV60629.1 MAG: peptidoglycan glycosyltransferase [Acidocella sp. 21-58-7]HQU03209.1 penicillin-binding protein 2 [Acidocella sp.]